MGEEAGLALLGAQRRLAGSALAGEFTPLPVKQTFMEAEILRVD